MTKKSLCKKLSNTLNLESHTLHTHESAQLNQREAHMLVFEPLDNQLWRQISISHHLKLKRRFDEETTITK